MARKRSSWDMMRRQSKVSQRENPPFALNPRYLSYDEDATIRPPSATEKYATLKKQFAEFLGINPAELRRRFEDSFDISPVILEKIINGNFDKIAGETNPWVRLLINTKEFACDKVLRGLLNDGELRTFKRAAWTKDNLQHLDIEWSKLGELSNSEFDMFQGIESRPDFWSPRGRPDFVKLGVIKRRRS